MVKMPNLDDLKKMGSDLIDSAKSVNLGEMVDKVKSGIESVSFKKGTEAIQGDDVVKNLFQSLQAILNELNEVQAKQVSLTRQLQQRLPELEKYLNTVSAQTTQSEDKK